MLVKSGPEHCVFHDYNDAFRYPRALSPSVVFSLSICRRSAALFYSYLFLNLHFLLKNGVNDLIYIHVSVPGKS